MRRLVITGLAGTAAVPTGVVAVLAGALGAVGATAPSAEALADIPPALLGAYLRSASSCPGLSWTVLAAVGKVESDHGRAGGGLVAPNGDVTPPIIGAALDGTGGRAAVADTDGGRLDGDATRDRAVGPMQFLPATWATWGRDATGDGRADPHNAFDAVASAAAYLCGPGGRVDDVAGAIGTYNRSDAYVAEVTEVAAGYGATSLTGSFVNGSPAGVVDNPAVVLSAPARSDLASGLVDPRLVSVLGIVAGRFPIGVGVIRTGHSQCVGGGSRTERPACSISNHWYYRGVDVTAVGGRPVSAGNDDARALVELVLRLPAALRPEEVGVPWAAMDPLPVVFSDSSHQDHIHLGWPPPARP